MKYESCEYRYAAPLALTLVEHSLFQQWVISKSAFSEFSSARMLHKEMAKHRSNSTTEWWRFHFTEKRRCLGCSGDHGRSTSYLLHGAGMTGIAL
jgi:hypothetical protein